jgi:hypothetical protein
MGNVPLAVVDDGSPPDRSDGVGDGTGSVAYHPARLPRHRGQESLPLDLVLGPMHGQPPQFASAGQPVWVAVGPEDGEDPLPALLLGSTLLDVLLALWRGIEDDGFRPLGLRVAGVDLVAKGIEIVHCQLRVVDHVGRQPRVGRRHACSRAL